DAGTMPPLRYEMKGVTKSGEILDLDVSVARIPWRGRWAVQGVYRDITERKRSEQVLLQKQKVESLGVLAGGVAHDFNNLLQAMLGHISLSLRRVPPESPAFANLQKAEKAAERASELTRQLLAYSGRGNFDIRPLSLNSIITENLHLLEVGVHKSIRLDKELASPLPLIDADAGQMQQVIMNLIINASEAIGERPGRILIRTQSMHASADDVPLWSQPGNAVEVGEYVLLEVNDDGSGMSSDTLRRIFDPFFTTKFTGRGLGLSAILGIVRGHHGGIRVQSELGKGTSFQLIFPVSSTLVAPVETPMVQPATSQFKGSVLVVDDEADVREVVVDLLREAGLRTMVAPNGEAGLTIYRRFKHEIDIVLLDLSMPGMGGKETFRLLKAENPEVRVIMSSGFSESDAMKEISELGLAGFIQKPYQWSRLIDVLRRVLPAL
ncbi:MAG: response regulator, partial [Bacteroidetes bacterium]|nr:response regulator [Bacteroidota bacterium]